MHCALKRGLGLLAADRVYCVRSRTVTGTGASDCLCVAFGLWVEGGRCTATDVRTPVAFDPSSMFNAPAQSRCGTLGAKTGCVRCGSTTSWERTPSYSSWTPTIRSASVRPGMRRCVRARSPGGSSVAPSGHLCVVDSNHPRSLSSPIQPRADAPAVTVCLSVRLSVRDSLALHPVSGRGALRATVHPAGPRRPDPLDRSIDRSRVETTRRKGNSTCTDVVWVILRG